jgi:hypothetical protein
MDMLPSKPGPLLSLLDCLRLQERQGSESKPGQGSDTVDWLATGACFIFPAVSGSAGSQHAALQPCM